ncbi:MAG: hypothetical protein LUH07_10655 [Lachnospiraceae bacterium]|nr:hypothetical protein [Lachnospiraceae bacterium]
MNKYYSYPGIELWEADQWNDRDAKIAPVLKKLFEIQMSRDFVSFPHSGDENWPYNFKTNAVTDPALTEYWDKKGYQYFIGNPGGKKWIGLIPKAVCNHRELSPKIYFRLAHTNGDDRHWAQDAMREYEAFNEAAARDGALPMYFCTKTYGNSIGSAMNPVVLVQEAALNFHFDLEDVNLDVSLMCDGSEENEALLAGYERFEAYGCTFINITNQWQEKIRGSIELAAPPRPFGPPSKQVFDYQLYRHSASGRLVARNMLIEHAHSSVDDPEILKMFDEMGLCLEKHMTLGEQWLSMVPKCCYDEPDKKIPVVLIMTECTKFTDSEPLKSVMHFYEYLDIAAHGETMLLYFAMEDADSCEMWKDIFEDAKGLFPIDATRVYITGHSHNGHFSRDFAIRHPEIITAVACLGNSQGFEPPEYSVDAVKVTDEQVERLSQYDVPFVNITGTIESERMITSEPGTKEFDQCVYSWNRRLKAFNCPAKTAEEFYAPRLSENRVLRTLALPVDRTELVYLHGLECFVGDVKNNEGNYHLRLIYIDNLTHAMSQLMPLLSWNFLRRFRRDSETGKIVDLY